MRYLRLALSAEVNYICPCRVCLALPLAAPRFAYPYHPPCVPVSCLCDAKVPQNQVQSEGHVLKSRSEIRCDVSECSESSFREASRDVTTSVYPVIRFSASDPRG